MHFMKKESSCGNCVNYSVKLNKEKTHRGHSREILFIRGIKNKIDLLAYRSRPTFNYARSLSSCECERRSGFGFDLVTITHFITKFHALDWKTGSVELS